MAKKNITANKARMFAYAKSGGLKGMMSGGSVLDKKQPGGAIAAKIIKKLVPVVKNKAKDIIKKLTPTPSKSVKPPIKNSTINDFLNDGN